MASKSKSSKKLAATVSFYASRIFFILIVLQIPLFRFPCSTTPIEVTCSQLIATEIIPVGVVKSLLQPGAIAKAVINNKPIPTFTNILHLYNLKNAPPKIHLQHIEVVAGSYLAVVGSIMGFFRSTRLGLYGIILIIWGLATDHNKDSSICYSTMTIAFLSAFFSIKRDAKMIISCFKWTFSKPKYK